MDKTLEKDFLNDENRKIFVVDTSVLLYDKNSIFNMNGNNIVIPLVVLEEIDKFKTREGLLGEYARFFNRFLDDLREKGSLHDGVYYEEADIVIQVKSNSCWAICRSILSSAKINQYLRYTNNYSDLIISNIIFSIFSSPL